MLWLDELINDVKRRFRQVCKNMCRWLRSNLWCQPLTRVDDIEPNVSWIGMLKRWTTSQEGIKDDTKGEDIVLISIPSKVAE